MSNLGQSMVTAAGRKAGRQVGSWRQPASQPASRPTNQADSNEGDRREGERQAWRKWEARQAAKQVMSVVATYFVHQVDDAIVDGAVQLEALIQNLKRAEEGEGVEGEREGHIATGD